LSRPLTFRRPLAGLALALTALLARPAHATMPFPSGTVPKEVAQAFADGALQVPARSPLSTSSAQTVWHIPIIMIGFTDMPLTYTPQDFQFELFDTTHATPHGSVFDYYRWASGGRLTVQGDVVAVVPLPHDHVYYGYNSWGLSTVATPNNMFGAIRDALLACQSQVNWSDYDMDHDGYVDMLWVIHAGVGGESNLDRNAFWSITSRMSTGWHYGDPFLTTDPVPGSTTQYMRLDRFSTMPEMSYLLPGRRSEIGVYTHEFGHALGLPDLYDTSGGTGGAPNMGPGNWALMSSGGYGANGLTPEVPAGMGAWSLLYLGWVNSVRPTQDQTMLLPPIENGGPVVDLWFQGEPNAEHFLVENRRRLGFDQYIPAEGLLVSHVDDAQIGALLPSNRINAGLTPGLTLLQGDGLNDLQLGHNRGDAGDPLPGSANCTLLDDDTNPSMRMFSGAITNVAVRDITPIGSDTRFLAQVRAPGWAAPEDHTDAAFAPVLSPSPAPISGDDGAGGLYEVQCEQRGAGTQVILYARGPSGWSQPFQVSNSSQSALDPTLAVLKGGDLAVAWRDTRNGRSQIWYRARIGGSWTAEQVLVDGPGSCYRPCLGHDARGILTLVWINRDTAARVMLMRFTYASPFGIPLAVSSPTGDPDSPALAVDTNGRSFVLWTERTLSPQGLMFARFTPDSGLFPALRFAPTTIHAQTGPAAVVDSSHVLHAVWLETAPGVCQLHYQRRDFRTYAWLRDTLLESQGNGLLHPTLAIDPKDGIHVAFESTISSVQQVRYRRYLADRGWDSRSTEVSTTADGDGVSPQVVALSPGNVTVLYTRYVAGTPRFMNRDRRLDAAPATAVEGAPTLDARARFALAPNPLRSGQGLDVWWMGPAAEAAPPLEFFDLAGRRVAALEFGASGTLRHARLSPSETSGWSSGVYFARVRGSSAPASRVVVLR